MSDQMIGSCLCGQVSFRVDNYFEHLYLCHCQQCRKLTGSAHASNLLTRPENLKWLSGGNNIKRFEYPGRNFTRAFCRDCGSGVPYVNQSGEWLIVPAGALEGEPEIADAANIFCAERPDWSKAGAAADCFQGFE